MINSNVANLHAAFKIFKWSTSLSVWFTVGRLGRLFMASVIRAKYLPARTIPLLTAFHPEAMQDLPPLSRRP
jgi:hypothetical protein